MKYIHKCERYFLYVYMIWMVGCDLTATAERNPWERAGKTPLSVNSPVNVPEF